MSARLDDWAEAELAVLAAGWPWPADEIRRALAFCRDPLGLGPILAVDVLDRLAVAGLPDPLSPLRTMLGLGQIAADWKAGLRP